MTIRFANFMHIFVLALTSLAISSLQRAEAAVKTTPINKTDLGSVNNDLVDSNVEVEATIKSITPPREGSKAPVKIELSDTTGSKTLVIWPDLYDVIKAQSPLTPGTVIHANVNVLKYRESIQLQVHAASDLKIVSNDDSEPAKPVVESTAPTPPPAPSVSPTNTAVGGNTPVAAITTALMNQDVTVQATITEVREPREGSKAPYIVTLTQDGKTVSLIFWSDMQKQIKNQLKVGNVVRVKAQVSEHRGALQIKLRNATDLTVITSAAPPATSP